MSKSSKKVRSDTVTRNGQAQREPTIPWSEWSDAELNAEKWDVPKNGTDGHFSDPEPNLMPPSLQEISEWRRGSAIDNLSNNPVVFIPTNVYPDFVKNNKHILHSEFVRWFVSTMISLQYIGRDGLIVEGESANFTWLGASLPWQGWMHVYSMNKAGKGTPQHQPVVNPNGKYVVRLFFMGFWRRFIVDDMIPVDKDGRPLLPRTGNDYELWPMLVAKALMKLASLSWTNQREINDFYPISCFTGWICLSLVSKSLSPNDKWDLLIRYVIGIDQPEKEEGDSDVPPSKRSEKSSIPRVTVFAKLAYTEEFETEDVTNITPWRSHLVYFDKFRGTSVNMSSPRMRWKLHRWFDWASRHGVSLSETYPGSGVRSLKLIDILTRTSKTNESDENTENVSESKKVLEATTSLPDIGMWTEFEKIAPYLEEIHILYKPTDFEYHARVSDLLPMVTDGGHIEGGGPKGKSQPGGGRDGKKVTAASNIAVAPAFLSSLKWQEKITNGKNGPLYMLIDSIDTKFVLIDYYWMSLELPGRRDDSSPSYLTVEKYNFFERSNDDEPAVASIQTFSSGATIFEAEPGRHLYRIFFRAECSFVRILSDTIFHLGDRLRIQELMSFESDRVEAIANNISNKVSQAFQAFGKPEYAGHLRALYKSYMPSDVDVPESNLDKKVRSSIHETFLRELGILVQDSLSTVTDSAVICRALRVFFMNPEFGIRIGNPKEQDRPNEEECDVEDAELTFYDKAVVGIQSFFKMALMGMYKSMHLSSHNKHSEIAQSLRKVVELFDYSKRESAARLLVRKVISSIPAEIRTLLYPCNKDLSHVLNIDECRGVLRNVQPNQWVPILRFVVNVPRPGDRVFAAMDLVTSLPRYLLRVVNNETHREIVRIGSTVATAHYPYVESGYTVIGYGWSDGNRFKELNWHFRVATIKGEPMFSPAVSKWIKPPGLCVQELSNIYVPNVGDIIGKWIVKVATDSLISFRLSTSYDLVEIVLKVFDRDDRVLYEATGGSVLILPSVLLSHVENRESFEGSILRLSHSEEGGDTTRTRGRSKSLSLHSTKEVDESPTEYHVRAYVANDSWPLKPSEWVVANEVKARGTIYDPRYGRTSTSSILKRGTRNRASEWGSGDRFETGVTTDGSSSTILQHPSCKLQVLTDAGTKVQVVHKKSIVEQDKRRETEITAMKRSWEDSEPGRLQRGRSLRESFLEENCVDFGSSEDEEGPLVSLAAGEIRTLKPPPNPSRILPSWNITVYVSKDEEEEDRWVKTEGDEEVLRNQRTIYSLDFDQARACRVEEDAEMIREQRRRYSELFNSYTRKVEEYKRLGDAVTEMRKFYISEIKPASPNRDGKNAEDTSMKKKKKKKMK